MIFAVTNHTNIKGQCHNRAYLEIVYVFWCDIDRVTDENISPFVQTNYSKACSLSQLNRVAFQINICMHKYFGCSLDLCAKVGIENAIHRENGSV